MSVHAFAAAAVIVVASGDGAGAPAQPAASTESVPVLRLGDRAPRLIIDTWVKGAPVGAFERGRVYVVEFWATWCGPCRANMPRLSELQRRHADTVTVIGVTSSERRGLDDVRPFVERQGDTMAYTVAWDDNARTHKAWMHAAGQSAIPCAFVVGKDGRIAWFGNPADGLEDAVAAVVAGAPVPAAAAR